MTPYRIRLLDLQAEIEEHKWFLDKASLDLLQEYQEIVNLILEENKVLRSDNETLNIQILECSAEVQALLDDEPHIINFLT